jgi:hypothetical protein
LQFLDVGARMALQPEQFRATGLLSAAPAPVPTAALHRNTNTKEIDSMVRGIVAGVVGLGLIGGAGSVAYNDDGTATIRIDERNTPNDASDDARVTFKANGKTYSCPPGVEAQLEPGDIKAGRIKITLKRNRQQLRVIEKAHPDSVLPPAVYDEYQRLTKRDDTLVAAFNDEVSRHNAILKKNCR